MEVWSPWTPTPGPSDLAFRPVWPGAESLLANDGELQVKCTEPTVGGPSWPGRRLELCLRPSLVGRRPERLLRVAALLSAGRRAGQGEADLLPQLAGGSDVPAGAADHRQQPGRCVQSGRGGRGPARERAAGSETGSALPAFPFLLFFPFLLIFPFFPLFIFLSCSVLFFPVPSLLFSPDSEELKQRFLRGRGSAVSGGPWRPPPSGPAVCGRGPGVSGGPGAPFGVTRGASLLWPGYGQGGALQSSAVAQPLWLVPFTWGSDGH